MKQQLFNDDWYFWKGGDSFALVWDVPESARKICLPHDAMIEEKAYSGCRNGSNTGFRDGGNYVYLKTLTVTEKELSEHSILKFEGSYMNTFVYVNGQLAGKHHFGYTTFYVPIHEFLHIGENEIRVQVRNGAMSNSRWYSGSGLYRDVYLLTSPALHITQTGVQVKTIELDNKFALVEVATPIENLTEKSSQVDLDIEILDPNGNLIQAESRPLFVRSGERDTFRIQLVIAQPKTWTAECPNLYHLKVRIVQGGDTIDSDSTNFGIRTINVDSKRGFRINGQTIKLRGACVHHDSGLLGATTYEAAHRRQITILKDAGFNAIRMAHHPAAPALLKICDELGMYVMDETFDMWTRFKGDFDYSLFFEESWRKDVTAMVNSDFNHPSVVMYSIGNEIPEIATQHGSRLAKEIHDHIKSLDNSRPTLAGINGVFASGDSIPQIMMDVVAENVRQGKKIEGNVNNFMTLLDSHLDQIVNHPIISKNLEIATASTDIAGYNYMTARYENDSKIYPNRIIVGSETYPPEIARNWELIKKLPNLIGDFTWTGWDYIGEAGVGIPAYKGGEGGFGANFPCQLAYTGDIDITGFRRPLSYHREIVFGLRKEPYIAVQNPHYYGKHLIKTPWVLSDTVSSWTWSGVNGKPVIVEVYAPGDEVALYLNDKLIAKKAIGESIGYRTLFETIYQPGVLKAVNYQGGEVISETTLKTVDFESLKLVNRVTNWGDLTYIDLSFEDAFGNTLNDKEHSLTVSLEGANLIGFGSGNPKSLDNYQNVTTRTYNGRALAIVRKVSVYSTLTVVSENETIFIDL
ncbi:glycoside hydrolase family 2 TIM barrel-domain containing protein [Streptococcus suis]